jgi:hypothetical protein
MTSVREYVDSDKDMQAKRARLAQLEAEVAALEKEIRDLFNLKVAEYLAEKNKLWGFVITPRTQVLCTPAIYEYADRHYKEEYPHRDDLTDAYFPLGLWCDVANVSDEGITLQGIGGHVLFPPELIKAMTRREKEREW